MGRGGFWGVLAAVCVVAMCGPGASAAAVPAVVDDFGAPGAWVGPIHQYGDRATGGARIADGLLRVTHTPRGRYHMVSMERTFPGGFARDAWFHVRFRVEERLLGADLYITLSQNGRQLVQLGVNGEMHWRMFRTCELKDFDDELFWGSPLIVGEPEAHKRTDFRVALPDGVAGRVRYTEWRLLSVHHEAGADGAARFRVYMDGREIPYRDLDAAAPAGGIDNRLAPDAAPPDERPLTVALGVMTDGDLYADRRVNDGAGIRWLHAFADNTPAIPTPGDPAAAAKRDAVALFDYVIVCDGASARGLAPTVASLVRQRRLDPAAAARVGLVAPRTRPWNRGNPARSGVSRGAAIPRAAAGARAAAASRTRKETRTMTQVEALPVLRCPHVDRPFAIDGDVRKAPWRDIDPAWFVPSTGAPVAPFWRDARVGHLLALTEQVPIEDTRWMPYQPTALRACWTDDALVLAFQCVDRDIWGTYTRRDEFVCKEEAVEAFLAPDGDVTRYWEFEVSPRNVIFDGIIRNPDCHRATMTLDTSWNCEGLQTAVKMVGTLERRTDTDLWWTVEMAIPFASLPGAVRPTPGAEWRANFFRIDGGPPIEYTAWSPTNVTPPSFHIPSRFGRIVFE